MKRIAKWTVALLAAQISLGAAVAYADYNDGLVLVRQGRWAKAMKEFGDQAAVGHAPSQFSLALIFHLGRGTPVNLERAYELYKKAVLNGHAPAINNMGMMYLNGEYVVQNRRIAFRMFEKASTEHAQAKDNLGQCYENGWGIERDIEQAMNFYQLAGDGGYKLGYYHLAQLHEEGRGGAPVNMEEAINWYRIAGEDTYARGYFRIGEIYEQGIGGIPVDKEKAKYWYQQADGLKYLPARQKLRSLK